MYRHFVSSINCFSFRHPCIYIRFYELNLSASNSLSIVNKVVNKLKKASGKVDIKIEKKVKYVFSNNPGLKTNEAIANGHNATDTQTCLASVLLNKVL